MEGLFAAIGLPAERVGDQQLAFDRASYRSQCYAGSAEASAFDYGQPSPWIHSTCKEDPVLVDLLLVKCRRLGVTANSGQPELLAKAVTYRADPGRLGSITIQERPISSAVRCMLISHECIHVLQHFQGDFRGVPPLGWTTEYHDPITQKSEAFGHQQQVVFVLGLQQQSEWPE